MHLLPILVLFFFMRLGQDVVSLSLRLHSIRGDLDRLRTEVQFERETVLLLLPCCCDSAGCTQHALMLRQVRRVKSVSGKLLKVRLDSLQPCLSLRTRTHTHTCKTLSVDLWWWW